MHAAIHARRTWPRRRVSARAGSSSPDRLTPAALIPPTIAGIPAQAVSVPVAAAMLGISDRSIRRMIASGDLPARKLPTGALSIRVVDLDAVGEPVGPRRG